ncbi:MAG TPA: hypothetical protein ENG50_04385, partial [Candidatus Altiarchaeales archaeon]|nr:hypothetical protein [Candidatus Altiarchaeales archaeon]
MLPVAGYLIYWFYKNNDEGSEDESEEGFLGWLFGIFSSIGEAVYNGIMWIWGGLHYYGINIEDFKDNPILYFILYFFDNDWDGKITIIDVLIEIGLWVLTGGLGKVFLVGGKAAWIAAKAAKIAKLLKITKLVELLKASKLASIFAKLNLRAHIMAEGWRWAVGIKFENIKDWYLGIDRRDHHKNPFDRLTYGIFYPNISLEDRLLRMFGLFGEHYLYLTAPSFFSEIRKIILRGLSKEAAELVMKQGLTGLRGLSFRESLLALRSGDPIKIILYFDRIARNAALNAWRINAASYGIRIPSHFLLGQDIDPVRITMEWTMSMLGLSQNQQQEIFLKFVNPVLLEDLREEGLKMKDLPYPILLVYEFEQEWTMLFAFSLPIELMNPLLARTLYRVNPLGYAANLMDKNIRRVILSCEGFIIAASERLPSSILKNAVRGVGRLILWETEMMGSFITEEALAEPLANWIILRASLPLYGALGSMRTPFGFTLMDLLEEFSAEFVGRNRMPILFTANVEKRNSKAIDSIKEEFESSMKKTAAQQVTTPIFSSIIPNLVLVDVLSRMPKIPFHDTNEISKPLPLTPKPYFWTAANAYAYNDAYNTIAEEYLYAYQYAQHTSIVNPFSVIAPIMLHSQTTITNPGTLFIPKIVESLRSYVSELISAKKISVSKDFNIEDLAIFLVTSNIIERGYPSVIAITTLPMFTQNAIKPISSIGVAGITPEWKSPMSIPKPKNMEFGVTIKSQISKIAENEKLSVNADEIWTNAQRGKIDFTSEEGRLFLKSLIVAEVWNLGYGTFSNFNEFVIRNTRLDIDLLNVQQPNIRFVNTKTAMNILREFALKMGYSAKEAESFVNEHLHIFETHGSIYLNNEILINPNLCPTLADALYLYSKEFIKHVIITTQYESNYPIRLEERAWIEAISSNLAKRVCEKLKESYSAGFEHIGWQHDNYLARIYSRILASNENFALNTYFKAMAAAGILISKAETTDVGTLVKMASHEGNILDTYPLKQILESNRKIDSIAKKIVAKRKIDLEELRNLLKDLSEIEINAVISRIIELNDMNLDSKVIDLVGKIISTTGIREVTLPIDAPKISNIMRDAGLAINIEGNVENIENIHITKGILAMKANEVKTIRDVRNARIEASKIETLENLENVIVIVNNPNEVRLRNCRNVIVLKKDLKPAEDQDIENIEAHISQLTEIRKYYQSLTPQGLESSFNLAQQKINELEGFATELKEDLISSGYGFEIEAKSIEEMLIRTYGVEKNIAHKIAIVANNFGIELNKKAIRGLSNFFRYDADAMLSTEKPDVLREILGYASHDKLVEFVIELMISNLQKSMQLNLETLENKIENAGFLIDHKFKITLDNVARAITRAIEIGVPEKRLIGILITSKNLADVKSKIASEIVRYQNIREKLSELKKIDEEIQAYKRKIERIEEQRRQSKNTEAKMREIDSQLEQLIAKRGDLIAKVQILDKFQNGEAIASNNVIIENLNSEIERLSANWESIREGNYNAAISKLKNVINLIDKFSPDKASVVFRTMRKDTILEAELNRFYRESLLPIYRNVFGL